MEGEGGIFFEELVCKGLPPDVVTILNIINREKNSLNAIRILRILSSTYFDVIVMIIIASIYFTSYELETLMDNESRKRSRIRQRMEISKCDKMKRREENGTFSLSENRIENAKMRERERERERERTRACTSTLNNA